MAQILVGTCGWADPSLLNAGFYPPGIRTPMSRMEYYSSFFRLVEVDSSYYAIPSESVAGNWTQWSPKGFVFDVKVFRLFTHHPTPPRALPPDIRNSLPPEIVTKSNVYLRDLPQAIVSEMWRRFESALLPLDSAGKLGVVLFQFPPWFLPGRESFDYISRLRVRLPQYIPAVEFRASDWLDARNATETLALLRSEALSYVCVDEPQGFKSSVPPVYEATADIALIRFHGRNHVTWEAKGFSAAQRFDYLYSEQELQKVVPRIRELGAKAGQMHVLFNNCYGDKAVTNARQMSAMLDTVPGSSPQGKE